MTILAYIQELLDEKDQPSTLMEPTTVAPYEHLLVACSHDDDDRADILQITAHPQFFEGAFTKENVPDTYHLLQMQFILPLEVPAENFNQVSSALHFFNSLLHCPGFELDELNDRVIYRYVWFIKRRGIDSFLLMQVIGNMQLCFRMFNPYIKEIAEGKYKLEDILEQVAKLVKQQR
jgi:hypothetical protein